MSLLFPISIIWTFKNESSIWNFLRTYFMRDAACGGFGKTEGLSPISSM